MTQEQTNAFDIYAAAALQGLIAKLPLIDRDGEFTKESMAQEKVNEFKDHVVRSSLDYAARMIRFRDEFVSDVITFDQCLREEFLINTQNYPREYHQLFEEKFNRATDRFNEWNFKDK